MADARESIEAALGNRYRIERELGRGGMGVVYLASDPRLDRRVAIKVLPDEVASNPERLARFEREAKLLASIKHPNIGGIHGLEEAGGHRYLVLEYLEGDTLAKRLDGGPLRAAEAVHVCRQIAAALEAAHDSGIVHRDLKPGNVMITDDDAVKVLDFGLAKGGEEAAPESSSDLSASPTMPMAATAAGVILGTAAYMSPEQARGRSVDRRTDIWSFGCVLYECLTGGQLFAGETVSDTIAKILEREPDWDALPNETPDRARDLLRRCLEKKARERLRDIGDARIELEEIESGKSSSVSGVASSGRANDLRGRLLVAWGVAAVAAVIAVAAVAMNFMRKAPAQQPAMRLEVAMPSGMQNNASNEDLAISPDGTKIAYPVFDSTGTIKLYVRELASLDAYPIEGANDAVQPFWSPDSRQLGFFSNRKLRTVSLEDGQIEILADVNASRGGSWGAEYIVYATAQGPIYRVPVGGGTAEAVTEVDTAAGHTAHRFPLFLPDGRRFIYSVLPPLTAMVKIHASDVSGATPKEIMSVPGRPGLSVDSGHLIWQRGSRLVAQRFNAGNLQLDGEVIPIGLAPSISNNSGAPPVSVSRNGTILQNPPTTRRTRLEWQDFKGNVTPLDLEELSYFAPSISPDGKSLAVTIGENDFQQDLWLIDLERMIPSRLTFGPGGSFQPFWSPRSDRIFYVSNRDGPIDLYVKSVEAPDKDTLFVDSDAMFKNAMGWSADGAYVLFTQPGTGTGIDLWKARVDIENAVPEPYLASPFNEGEGKLSPDGRWCAYTSDESGASEIYVTSFPEPGRRTRVTRGGGFGPAWRYDGREILFILPDGSTAAVSVEASAGLRIGPRRILRGPTPEIVGGTISPVEAKFLAVIDTSPQARPGVMITTGWQSELE